MAILKTTRYHIEITNIDKNGHLNIIYPKNTVDDVYMDPKKNITIKGKVSFYAASSINADVQIKDLSVPGFQLVEGAHLTVLFEKGITASNAKLRISNGITKYTEIPILYQNKPLLSDLIKSMGIVNLVYSVGNFHVIHNFVSPPLSKDNTRKIFLTGVDTSNAKSYPDEKYYDDQVYIDETQGRLHASTFLGTTYYMGGTNAYINSTDYTGNSATATQFKTARDIIIGKKTNSFDGTKNIEFTLDQIDAVSRDGDTVRGDLKITSGTNDDRYVLYRGNGIVYTFPSGGKGYAGGISWKNPDNNSVEASFGYYRNNFFYFGKSYDNPDGIVKAKKYIGNLEGTADVSNKLGATTVGSSTRFFYLNDGVATESTETVGSGIKPIFLSSGTFTESGSTIGSKTKGIYMKSGTITESDATVGSADIPVYMNKGEITSTGKSFSNYLPLSGGTLTGTLTAPTFSGNLSGNASTVSSISGHIRDNLSGNGVTDKALSANQGYLLKAYVDSKMPYSYFHWNGLQGQPAWLWGGNIKDDYYLYNPANFSVNYANSAGVGNSLPTNGVYFGATNASPWIQISNGDIRFWSWMYGEPANLMIMQAIPSQNIYQIFSSYDGQVNLGLSSFRWKQIYATSSAISTSDERLKDNINPLNDDLIKKFVMGLTAISYTSKEGDSGRTHYGFGAQSVEKLMESLGMSSLDFAGFIKSPKDELKKSLDDNAAQVTRIPNEYIYGLRYEEFIAPAIKMIQIQQEQINSLEMKLEQIMS